MLEVSNRSRKGLIIRANRYTAAYYRRGRLDERRGMSNIVVPGLRRVINARGQKHRRAAVITYTQFIMFKYTLHDEACITHGPRARRPCKENSPIIRDATCSSCRLNLGAGTPASLMNYDSNSN